MAQQDARCQGHSGAGAAGARCWARRAGKARACAARRPRARPRAMRKVAAEACVAFPGAAGLGQRPGTGRSARDRPRRRRRGPGPRSGPCYHGNWRAAAQPMGAHPAAGAARRGGSQWARPLAGSPRSPGQQDRRRRRRPIGAARSAAEGAGPRREGRGLAGPGSAGRGPTRVTGGSRVAAPWAARAPFPPPTLRPALTHRQPSRGETPLGRAGGTRVQEGTGLPTPRGTEGCEPRRDRTGAVPSQGDPGEWAGPAGAGSGPLPGGWSARGPRVRV